MAVRVVPRTPTLSISVSAASDTDLIIAPAPVWFDATSAGFRTGEDVSGIHYDPDFHEIYYRWTVRGTPLTSNNRAASILTQWDEPNVAYGKKVAFCFDAPGSYIVDLWAIDRYGNSASASSSTVVVRDPDTAFSGTNTICYSEAGDFTGAPSGAQQVTTRSAADAAIAAATTDPARLLFRAGETFLGESTGTGGEWEFPLSSKLMYIGAFGAGAKPIVRPVDGEVAGIFEWNRSSTNPLYTIEGLELSAYWDETKELGTSCANIIDANDKWYQNDSVIILHDCDVTGVNGGFKTQGNFGTGHKWMVSQCDITNFQNYCVFGTGTSDLTSRLALLDNYFHRGTDCLQGGGEKSMRYNMHGPVRLPGMGIVYMARNQLFSHSGWGENVSNGPATQACFRPNTNGVMNCTYIVERNVMEGGLQIVDANTADDGQQSNPWHAIFENNMFVSNAGGSGPCFHLGHGGTTLRNNYYWRPNRQEYTRSGSPAFVQATIENNQNGNSAEPVLIYNNTTLGQMDVASDPLDRNPYYTYVVNSGPEFTTLVEENNVLHFPDKTTPQTDDGPFDLTTLLTDITPQYNGKQLGFEYFFASSAPAVVNNASWSDIPYDNWTTDANVLTDRKAADYSLAEKPTGTASTQSYWTAIPASNDMHMLRMNGFYYHEHTGEIEVTYGASGISIKNTSGVDFPAGADWRVKLDRSNLIAARDASRATSTSTTPTPPVVAADTGSPSLGAADTGWCAYDDFFRVARPATGKDAGAFQT